MSTFRVHKNKNHPYTVIDNTSINDKRLSAKAKGILLYLISKPDHWYINLPNLVSAFAGGKWSIRAGIKELIKFGYIVRSQCRKENGHFSHYDYLVFEQPIKSPLPPITFTPECGNRTSGNRTCGNHTLLSTDNKESTERKKTTTAFVVLPDNAAADSSLPDIEKEKLITKLHNLKITDHKKLFELFSLHDILKYSTWIEQRNRSMKNPTGFFITAIKEKWMDNICEESQKEEELLWWYKCKVCKKTFGRQTEFEGLNICYKCDTIRKAEERKIYLKEKKRLGKCPK